jgi:hypothetical protein
MVIKYSDRPVITTGTPAFANEWRTRFPAHVQPMESAPTTASTPIKLYEPSGSFRYGINYLGAWREVEWQKDTAGRPRVTMNGKLISNPVAWTNK